mgnify:CR=1 FL=1
MIKIICDKCKKETDNYFSYEFNLRKLEPDKIDLCINCNEKYLKLIKEWIENYAI